MPNDMMIEYRVEAAHAAGQHAQSSGWTRCRWEDFEQSNQDIPNELKIAHSDLVAEGHATIGGGAGPLVQIQLVPEVELVGAYQDGDSFWRELTPEEAASGEGADNGRDFLVQYPGMVKNDGDVAGAERARNRFATEFPHYVKRNTTPPTPPAHDQRLDQYDRARDKREEEIVERLDQYERARDKREEEIVEDDDTSSVGNFEDF